MPAPTPYMPIPPSNSILLSTNLSSGQVDIHPEKSELACNVEALFPYQGSFSFVKTIVNALIHKWQWKGMRDYCRHTHGLALEGSRLICLNNSINALLPTWSWKKAVHGSDCGHIACSSKDLFSFVQNNHKCPGSCEKEWLWACCLRSRRIW